MAVPRATELLWRRARIHVNHQACNAALKIWRM
jgi:hypothetical protein